MSITALKVNSILLQIIKWLRFKPSFRKTINYVYDGDENRIPNNHDLLSRTRTDCALSPEFRGGLKSTNIHCSVPEDPGW